MRHRAWLQTTVLAMSLCTATLSWAQATDGLEAVERAYAEVDFEKTRDSARAALERGGNDRPATARLYLLWGISAAALDHAEEARVAFLHVLASSPELRLDKNLSPKIRAPYLEARGKLALDPGQAPLELDLRPRQSALELQLRDTLQVAKRVDFHVRSQAEEYFSRRRFAAEPARLVALPQGESLELFVQVLDAHDNVLFELGSRDAPRQLALAARADRAGPRSGDRAGAASPTAYHVTALALGALGVGSGIAAGVMHAKREDAAREWNGPSCEKPGATRAEQCGEVDRRRQRAQDLTIGLSAGSAALVIGSIVALALAPSSSKAGVGFNATSRSMELTWWSAL